MALHDLLDLELTVPEPDALMAFWERLGMVRSGHATLGTDDRPSQWLLMTASLSVVLIGRDVEDEDGRWESASDLGAVGAVVVRPDQHVAWRSRGPSAEPETVLRAVLAELSWVPAGS